MMSCTTRLRSAPKGAPVPRKPPVGKKENTANHPLRPQIHDFSIAGKLFRPNIVFVYANLTKRSARSCDHRWRPSYVIDRASQDAHVCEKHFRADTSNLPLPTVIVGHAREGGNKAEPWICTL